MDNPEIPRRNTRTVDVGGVKIGGGSPVVLQSMTNTVTADVAATLAQAAALADAGAALVRVAAARPEDTAALPAIVARSPVPIVADVHFHYRRALEAVAAGVAKIRLNPGNIDDAGQVRAVIDAAGAAGAAIRIGVNAGSIVPPKQRGDAAAVPLVDLMVDRLGAYLRPFEEAGFGDLVLSAKSPDAATVIAANRAIAARWDYPLHIGVTHAGTPRTGTIRSAAALGALLSEGIGDTLRISFAGDPVAEVRAGAELLCALGLREREGVELIACPTCGRLQTDMTAILARLEEAVADIRTPRPVTVAVMGCAVNGPGEAAAADVAVCAGKGELLLYRGGRPAGKVAPGEAVEVILAEIRSVCGERGGG